MPFCEYCGHAIDSGASFCPNCGKPVKSTSPELAPNTVQPQTQEKPTEIPEFNIQTILVAGENVAWHIDFMEGIIHRHPKSTYAITNYRVLAIDRLTAKLAISLSIKDTEVIVMNKHSQSEGYAMGTYHGGMYGGRRVGASTEVGEVVFLTEGVKRITLGGIKDPSGVKNLFDTIKKSEFGSGRFGR